MTSPQPLAASGVSALVTGATGMQGGAVARALHGAGMAVTALVRDPDGAPARALAGAGIGLAVGDLDDGAGLATACAGATTVFSVQPAPYADRYSERRQAANLVRAARDAGVQHLVHTSVSGTGWQARHPDVDPGATRNYWASKEEAETSVREAGFPAYTIVKPAYFMENFVTPKVDLMFPLLPEGDLLVASAPSTELALVTADDFGPAVARVAAHSERFAGAEIELGSDLLTFGQIAAVLSAVTGRRVTATHAPAEEVDARLGRKSWSATQTWLDAVGYPARPEHAAERGLELPSTFRQWAERHREELIAATTPRPPR